MRVPQLPPEATRFFARVLSADLECPRCGMVLHLHTHARAYRAANPAKRRTSTKGWNGATSRLACPGCDLVLLIGLVAWPTAQGGSPGSQTIPRDQVPNERQLAQLRAEAGGWWMPEETRKPRNRPDDSNITAKCSCPEGKENTSGGDPQCPIHGEAASAAGARRIP